MSYVRAMAFLWFLGITACAYAAHPSHTNVWTGAGGDFRWNNAENWKDYATGGAWTPPSSSTDTVAPAWNLEAFPADETLTNDYVGTLRLGGLIFGKDCGVVTIVSASASCVLNFIKSNLSPWIYPQVVVPTGTSVDLRARFVGGWNQSYVYLRGGGEFKVNGYFSHETTLRLFLQDITFVVGKDWQDDSSVDLSYVIMDSGKAVFRMEQDRHFGYVMTSAGVTGAKMYLDGHKLTMRVPTPNNNSATNSAEIVTAGAIETRYGFATCFNGGFAADCGGVEFIPANGDIHVGDESSALSAPSGSRYVGYRNGRLHLYGDASFSSIVSTNAAGGLSIASGKVLTVNGAAGEVDVVNSPITGGGGLTVDGGKGYELRLGGANDFASDLRIVGGKVSTSRPYRAADGLVAYYTFDGEDDDGGMEDVTSGERLATQAMTGTTMPAVADGGLDGSRCAHFEYGDSVRQSIQTVNSGTEREDLLEMTNSFTVVMWLRPDGSTMEGGRSGTKMELFYNGWPANEDSKDHGMAWIRLSAKDKIDISGFEENALNGVTMPIPEGVNLFDCGWHQLAFNYDKSERRHRVYLDGALLYERKRATDYHFYVRDNWRFGVRVSRTEILNDAYHGDMDNLQLWNRALTATEIADDFRRCGSVSSSEVYGKTKPIAHWRFDDPTDIGRDSSGNGNHLTAVAVGDAHVGSADSSACPGVNGLAARIPPFKDGYGAHLQYDNGLPDGFALTNSFTFTIRMMASGENVNGLFFLGSSANDKFMKIVWKNWMPYMDFQAFGWSYTDSKMNYVLGGEGCRSGWKDFAVVYDESARTMRIYWDGALVNEWKEYRISDAGADPRFYIGYDPFKNGRFPEYVDDCRMYDRALTSSDIREIVRENSNAGNSTDNVLPNGVNVTVGARGELEIGHNQSVGSLEGLGTVSLPWASLSIGGNSEFAGALKGHGDVVCNAAVSFAGDGYGYDGRITANGALSLSPRFENATVVIPEGAVLSFVGDGSDKPFVDAVGSVVDLPTRATVNVSGVGGSGDKDIVIVRGGTLRMADDLSGWKVSGVERFRLFAKGNELTLRVFRPGFTMIVR